jgi:cathepsin A (carboxypeptidase C)
MYIGNGYVNEDLNTDTMVEWGYTHGIMSEQLSWNQIYTNPKNDFSDWDFSQRTCCDGCSDFCPFHRAKGGSCEDIVTATINTMWNGGMNPYDMYRDCATPANAWTTNKRYRVMANGLAPPAMRLFLQSAIRNATNLKSTNGQTSARQLTVNAPECMNDTAVEMYLNRRDVQDALHVSGHSQTWTMCRFEPNFHQV